MENMSTRRLQHSLAIQISQTNGARFLFSSMRVINKVFRFEFFDHKFVSFLLLYCSTFHNNDGDSRYDKKQGKICHDLKIQCDFVNLKLQNILIDFIEGDNLLGPKNFSTFDTCVDLPSDEHKQTDAGQLKDPDNYIIIFLDFQQCQAHAQRNQMLGKKNVKSDAIEFLNQVIV